MQDKLLRDGVARAAFFMGIACSSAPPSELSHHVQLQEGKEVALWVIVAS